MSKGDLIFHGGSLDGQPLDVMAPPGPHDDGYEVRITDEGRILGAWWTDQPLDDDGDQIEYCCLCGSPKDEAHGLCSPGPIGRWAMQTLGRFLLWLSARIEQIRPLPTQDRHLIDDDGPEEFGDHHDGEPSLT